MAGDRGTVHAREHPLQPAEAARQLWRHRELPDPELRLHRPGRTPAVRPGRRRGRRSHSADAGQPRVDVGDHETAQRRRGLRDLGGPHLRSLRLLRQQHRRPAPERERAVLDGLCHRPDQRRRGPQHGLRGADHLAQPGRRLPVDHGCEPGHELQRGGEARPGGRPDPGRGRGWRPPHHPGRRRDRRLLRIRARRDLPERSGHRREPGRLEERHARGHPLEGRQRRRANHRRRPHRARQLQPRHDVGPVQPLRRGESGVERLLPGSRRPRGPEPHPPAPDGAGQLQRVRQPGRQLLDAREPR